ncbi:MAG: YdcF family protein [Lachnospiraceae bacterium]|nr:YdcF family protein [Lachnospiraceae bacterium]
MKALATTFFLLAGICIAYLMVILGYSGIGTSYWGIWLFFALLFIVMGVFTRRGNRDRDGMPRALPTFIFTSFGFGAAVFALILGLVVGETYKTPDTIPDYCIVMGARVYSDGISKTLMYRLDKAVELYKEDKDTIFVVAGGQEKGDAVPEALAMYNYLVMKGVPGSNMIIQAGSTSTAEIISTALRQIVTDSDRRKIPKGPGDKVWAEDYVPTIGIITSDYHLLRAVRVAEKQGVEKPVPIGAESDDILFVHQCVRESLAFVKDYLLGNFSIDEGLIAFDISRG